MHYKKNPEQLEKEAIDDYLFHCKNQHNTPSESFFKPTIYGLRAVYKLLGMDGRKVQLPEIKGQHDLPTVMSLAEVKKLISAPKYLKHRLMIATLYGYGLRSYELLEVPYFHVVFTLASEFNEYALREGKIIYGSLFKAAWQTLQQFGDNPKHLGAKMGMISVLHTFAPLEMELMFQSIL